MQIDESIKNIKEIKDIIDEYKKTDYLLNIQMWDELRQHLVFIQNKYPAEVATYNMTTSSPPASLQENAQNCKRFLTRLLEERGFKDMIRWNQQG